MTMWEAASHIDFSVDPEWPRVWEAGGVRLLDVSADSGVAVRLDETGRTHLASRSSTGVLYEPNRHFYLGRVDQTMIFTAGRLIPSQINLRHALTRLPEVEVELAVRAVSLTQYHATNRFCPRCGGLTRVDDLGRSRFCDHCETPLFPRTDPAIIVAITDTGDRLLLGHHAGWEDNRYSIFAGFAEAGESLEQTVCREMAEEVNVTVADVRYAGSQPWPMPHSLMVGFTAVSVTGEFQPDGTEITHAEWFDRSGLRAAVQSGQVVLPTPASIAYRLIMQWYGQADELGGQP
ncbi:MAG: NAD(+) diphosphatase [Propionibacteriaceae bacterium]|nr:NAD(+) diphosphatase [Propionibacteriaceae bacterium]